MFLRPHHFQQHDRYLESLVETRSALLRAYGWGITELEIDEHALALGKFAIARCAGIMPDGTPINIPKDDDPPIALEVPPGTRDCIVLLTLPLRRPGATTPISDEHAQLVRHIHHEIEVRDPQADEDIEFAPIEVASLNLSHMLETDDHGPYTSIGLARVVQRDVNNVVELDPAFVPPCLDYRASARLRSFMAEIERLLRTRGDTLAARVSHSGHGAAAEVAEFLRLQTINRFEPMFAHLCRARGLHPEICFRSAVQVAGELATFTRETRRTVKFPEYQHDDLQATFEPVILELRRSLTAVERPAATPLPILERRFGIHVASVDDADLLDGANFVLAVNADLPPEKLLRQVPGQVKVAPRELIRQLVMSHLPGIALRPLSVTPRQIPYHAGATYFELDRASEYWQKLESPSGFAFHIAGDFPGIEMEFWAIRD